MSGTLWAPGKIVPSVYPVNLAPTDSGSLVVPGAAFPQQQLTITVDIGPALFWNGSITFLLEQLGQFIDTIGIRQIWTRFWSSGAILGGQQFGPVVVTGPFNSPIRFLWETAPGVAYFTPIITAT